MENEITRRLRSLLTSQQNALMRAEESLAVLRTQIEAEKQRELSGDAGVTSTLPTSTGLAYPVPSMLSGTDEKRYSRDVSSATFDGLVIHPASAEDTATVSASSRDGRPSA